MNTDERQDVARSLWLARYGDMRGWTDTEPNWALTEADSRLVRARLVAALDAASGGCDHSSYDDYYSTCSGCYADAVLVVVTP